MNSIKFLCFDLFSTADELELLQTRVDALKEALKERFHCDLINSSLNHRSFGFSVMQCQPTPQILSPPFVRDKLDEIYSVINQINPRIDDEISDDSSSCKSIKLL